MDELCWVLLSSRPKHDLIFSIQLVLGPGPNPPPVEPVADVLIWASLDYTLVNEEQQVPFHGSGIRGSQSALGYYHLSQFQKYFCEGTPGGRLSAELLTHML
jgi:hypothetical protein